MAERRTFVKRDGTYRLGSATGAALYRKTGGTYVNDVRSAYKKVSGTYEPFYARQILYMSEAWYNSGNDRQAWVDIPTWYTGDFEWRVWNTTSGTVYDSGTNYTSAAYGSGLYDAGGVYRQPIVGHYIIMSPVVDIGSFGTPNTLGFVTDMHGDIGITNS